MRAFVGLAWRIASHPAFLLLVFAAGIYFAYEADNAWEPVPMAMGIAGIIVSLLFLITARPAFSVYVGWMAIAVLTLVSAIKYKMKGFSLHYYDAWFFGSDPEIYRFLVQSFLHLLIPVAIALLIAIAAGVLLFRSDRRSRLGFFWRTVPLAASAALAFATVPDEAVKNRFFYYMQGRHMTASFVSLMDLGNLLRPNELEQRLAGSTPLVGVSSKAECELEAARPDIFMVLSESAVDPSIFPQIAGGEGFLQRYAPDAGKVHPMSVETFGGGTWITNLSVHTGLSATDFGWRSPYLTLMLQDKVGGSLPQVLAACGYRTVVLTPMQRSFVNEGPFLESIGFETIIDKDDIQAPYYHLRDEFYFKAAEAFIARHRAEDGRPLFLEIQTMFPHSPYQEKLLPELAVSGEPFSKDPEVAEYLRRLAVQRQDFQAFLEHRKLEPTKRGSVVLEFGDHQSFVTKPYVDELAGADAMGQPNSLAYRTYYTVTPFNFKMREAMPETGMDVGFIGASFLKAAGLPMSPMMRDLVALRDRCGGRYHTCENRAAVDRHLRAREDAGLLDLIEGEKPSQLIALRR